MSREAYVSLVTNDNYATGALAVARSLKETGTERALSLLITNEVSTHMRERLSDVWDELTLVEEIDSRDSERLALLTRPELGVTFSKIHAWRLTQYSKCVFLDADTLVLQNVDELFDREELSAAPDIGWPDCFNSGVFVFEPSLDTFYNLADLAQHTGSFDGGDQGLLNLYWSDWATKDIKYHLPFIYNVVPNVTYGYAPALQRFGRNAKIIHFIGPVKPWQHRYVPGVDTVILSPGSYATQKVTYDYIKRWWHVYNRAVQYPTWSGGAAYSRHLPTLTVPSFHHTPRPSVHLDTTIHSLPLISLSPSRHYPSSHVFVPSTSYMSIHTDVRRHSLPICYSVGHFGHVSLPMFDDYRFLYPHDRPSIVRVPSGSQLVYMADIYLPWGGTGSDVVTIPTDSVLPYHAEHIFPLLSPSSFHSASLQPRDKGTSETGSDRGEVRHYYPPGKSSEQTDFEQGRIDYTGKDRFESLIASVLDTRLD